MYKILIADNPESINTAAEIVQLMKKKIEIAALVYSGTDLIRLVEELEPDIALINVDLMGINGLEAAKRIRRFNKSMHIIIVSEYDYFEFALQAISVSADDYILKPLTYETVGKSIEKTMEDIAYEKEKKSREENCRSLKKTYYEFLDYSFIYTILFHGQYNLELDRYNKIFDLTECGYIINIELEMKEDNVIDRSLLYESMKRIISNDSYSMVGPLNGNKIVVFMASKAEQEEQEESNFAKNLSEHIIEELSQTFNLKACIGVGSRRKMEDIHVSYEEAVLSLRYRRKANIVTIQHINKNEYKPQEYLELERKLLESIKFGKEESLNLFLDILELLKPVSIDAKKNKIVELLILLSHEARLEPQSVYEYVDYVSYFEEIRKLSWKQIESWAYQRMEYMIKAIRMNRKTKRSHFINDAIYYMERHYHEEISLDDLSQYIGLSSQHLSKLFKDETGINYVEYLTNMRIDMAKNLLSEGTQTVKEICYSVGYNDPNYFSRIFKRIVGISPSDYASGEHPSSTSFSK
jgi:Response regulator containing CheY-like receiver domain and AraC-type DNA-binding domain